MERRASKAMEAGLPRGIGRSICNGGARSAGNGHTAAPARQDFLCPKAYSAGALSGPDAAVGAPRRLEGQTQGPVSYTHLDVYKRQV